MQGCASHFPTLRFVGVTIANPVLGFFYFIYIFFFLSSGRDLLKSPRLKFGFCNIKRYFVT